LTALLISVNGAIFLSSQLRMQKWVTWT